MEQGSHHLAIQHLDFLEQEMLTMVQKGQWLVLPYKDIKNLPNLRLSPLGVVPQCNWCPHTIANYTFSQVNADIVPLTDHMPLKFGRTLLWILQTIVNSHPSLGPIYIIKIDLANGFYHIHLTPCQLSALGVAFPTRAGAPKLVAFLLTVPMGWTSLPPLFCTATKTITDLANATLCHSHTAPLHCLEATANTMAGGSKGPPVTMVQSTQTPPMPLA